MAKKSSSKLSKLFFWLSAVVAAGALMSLALYFVGGIPSPTQANAQPTPAAPTSMPTAVVDAQKAQMEQAVSGDTIFSGVTVAGMDVSGLTYEQALAAVQQNEAAVADSVALTLTYQGQSWALPAGVVQMDEAGVASAVERAYALGREGALADRYDTVTKLQTQPQDIAISRTFTIDEQALAAFVAETIDPAVGTPATGYVITDYVEDEGFVVSEGTPGTACDQTALMGDLLKTLAAEEYTGSVEITLADSADSLAKEYLDENYALIGSFTTTAKNDWARNMNIRQALSTMQGYVLPQGESFSTNTVLGKRTAENGYHIAGVIENGSDAKDYGGGICQVSSTLFNAVARAGLQIDVRAPHSWPSAYVGAGLDAMINWPDQDFIFTNNTAGDVIFITRFDWNKDNNAGSRKLTVELYGKSLWEENVAKVDLYAEMYETLAEPDPIVTWNDFMYEDQVIVEYKGRSGSRWRTYRRFYDADGELIRQEELCTSTYRAIPSRIFQGTKPRSE